jgi:tetratricopeptide (TPR) repeat protein
MHLASARLGSVCLALLTVAGLVAKVGAQAISQGFDLERQGRVDQAAGLYTSVLRGDPANLPALLGLERVLPGLGRLPELLPLVRRALAADSGAAIRGLAVRTFVVLDEVDSAAALGRRWAAQRPQDPAPWREWAIALEDQQRFDAAYNVLMEGRRTIGTPGALAIELAELGQRTGDWQAAGLEWAAAVSVVPSQLPNAVGQLEDAPLDQHDRVIHALTVPDAPAIARRLAAELLLGWGQPERAWDTFAATLEPPSPETAFALRRFADRAGGAAPGVRRVRGLALAHLADLVPGPLAARARAEAARALLDAGDRVAARSVLARLAGDSTAPADAQALARSALVEALIADGQLDSATAALAGLEQEQRGNGEERERLRHALVGAWIATGRLDRAEQALGADSSVVAFALRGWVELYRGDLQSAVESFRRAGPYAGDRDAATARTTVLALLEQIDAKRSPELGVALLTLARGDSSGAVSGLRRAASRLPSARGRPDVLLRAAQIAVGQGPAQEDLAGDLLAEVVRTGGRGAAAPAAELEWARLLLRQGRPADAVSHLEHLILTYPGSAVVPEARRELERAKGAIPRS